MVLEYGNAGLLSSVFSWFLLNAVMFPQNGGVMRFDKIKVRLYGLALRIIEILSVLIDLKSGKVAGEPAVFLIALFLKDF